MTNQVLKGMLDYFQDDIKRINHSLKVFGYAKTIGGSAGISPEEQSILECGAILHDIGIPESLRRHGSAEGKFQEACGVEIGGGILKRLNCPQDFMEKVLFLIGNHHSFEVEGGQCLQILFEADFLVNLEEGNLTRMTPVEIRDRYFKTAYGRALINQIFGLDKD